MFRMPQRGTVNFKRPVRQKYIDHKWLNREIKIQIHNGHYQLHFYLPSLKIIPCSHLLIFSTIHQEAFFSALLITSYSKRKTNICICSPTELWNIKSQIFQKCEGHQWKGTLKYFDMQYPIPNHRNIQFTLLLFSAHNKSGY